jgi:HNH endonuclease
MESVPVKIPKLSASEVNKFWSRYNCEGSPDGCWIPDYGRNSKGYCNVWIAGACRLAHRVAYEIVNGPTKKHVLHSCDNPACGNPNHLHAGTNTENHHECLNRGRWPWKIKQAQIDEIKARWANRLAIRVTQRQLSMEYGVSQPWICGLLKREEKSWRP